MASADPAAASEGAATNGCSNGASPAAYHSTPTLKNFGNTSRRSSIGVSDDVMQDVVRAVSAARESLDRVPPSPSPIATETPVRPGELLIQTGGEEPPESPEIHSGREITYRWLATQEEAHDLTASPSTPVVGQSGFTNAPAAAQESDVIRRSMMQRLLSWDRKRPTTAHSREEPDSERESQERVQRNLQRVRNSPRDHSGRRESEPPEAESAAPRGLSVLTPAWPHVDEAKVALPNVAVAAEREPYSPSSTDSEGVDDSDGDDDPRLNPDAPMPDPMAEAAQLQPWAQSL